MDSATVERTVRGLEACRDADAMIDLLLGTLTAYGGIGFTAADFTIDARHHLLLYTSMPEVFTPLDIESAWWSDDPVVARLASGEMRPFDVEEAWADPLSSAAPRWAALTDLRLNHGWVFPTSKPGFVGGMHVIADPDDPGRLARHLDTVHLVATYVHAYLTEADPDADGGRIVRNTLRNRPMRGPNTKLSPREVACLRWCAFGKSAEDIALIEGLSPHTVRDYLRGAMAKLDSRTQAQAVARALRYGIFRV